MISIQDLSVHYAKQPTPALDHIHLQIAARETVAIMGQSGSGKSTLLAVLGAMMRASSGSYTFRGQEVASMSASELTQFRGREVGFVFQNFFLLPHLTLLENLLVPMEHLKMDRASSTARAHTLLEQVGIANLATRYPAQVSGGQMQRAAIARALMRQPALILADEPTGSLDEESANGILALLCDLAANGTTLVVVTHSAQVANFLARTIRIEKGQILAAPEARAA